MTPTEAIFLFFALSGLVCLVVVLFLLYRRQDIQPIRGRQTSGGYFLIPIGIAYGILVAFDILFVMASDSLSMVSKSIMMHAMRPMLGSLYIARALVLLLQHRRSLFVYAKMERSEQQRQHNTTQNGFEDKDTNIVAPRFITKPPTLLLHISVFALIAIIWITSVVYDIYGRSSTDTLDAVYFAWSMLIVALVLVLAWNLRFCHDAFGITKELALVAVAITIFMIVNNLAKAYIEASSTKPLKMHSLMVAECFILATITLAHPLFLSYHQEYNNVESSADTTANSEKLTETRKMSHSMTLEQVLDDSVQLAAFTKHLQDEYSLENLLFWRNASRLLSALERDHDVASCQSNEDLGISHRSLAKRTHLLVSC